jgi:ABC-type antimicrobial peptide transport system permease subunit
MSESLSSTVLEIRTGIPPDLFVPAVRDTVQRTHRAIGMEFGTLERQIDDSLTRERLLAILSGFFGILGMVLTVIGLYGVMAYVVSRRRKEFGIRMAVGAPQQSILRLVFKDVAGIVAAGVLAGAAVSLVASSMVEKMLFGLPPRDATTLVVASGILCLVGLLAGQIPARRAARLDPMTVLRED